MQVSVQPRPLLRGERIRTMGVRCSPPIAASHGFSRQAPGGAERAFQFTDLRVTRGQTPSTNVIGQIGVHQLGHQQQIGPGVGGPQHSEMRDHGARQHDLRHSRGHRKGEGVERVTQTGHRGYLPSLGCSLTS